MGVLNVTPDSFSDGGLYFDTGTAVDRGMELISQGADIIDIGGESSRPGSDPVSAEEEIKRIIPVIGQLRSKSDVLISIDTTKAAVAEAALDCGADIINDISALRFDAGMAGLAARRKAPLILMHMKGTPKTMQTAPFYGDVIKELMDFFRERIAYAASRGLEEERILIDPGIGFGKRLEDNLVLIKHLGAFEALQRPILVGVSRKSFIGRILDIPAGERLEGTIAASIMCVLNGARILRVHDVGAVRRAVLVAEAVRSAEYGPSEGGERENRYVF
jgi:dihydropteroate synthase